MDISLDLACFTFVSPKCRKSSLIYVIPITTILPNNFNTNEMSFTIEMNEVSSSGGLYYLKFCDLLICSCSRLNYIASEW